MTSFAKRLEPSMRAPAATGPNAVMPTAWSASTRPFTSGASGPTTTRSGRFASAQATMPAMSSAPIARFVAHAAVPAFPGAQNNSCPAASCANRHVMACSRPPDPTTRIFMDFLFVSEFVASNRFASVGSISMFGSACKEDSHGPDHLRPHSGGFSVLRHKKGLRAEVGGTVPEAYRISCSWARQNPQ